MALQYGLLHSEVGTSNLTVLMDGEFYTVQSDHPAWKEIFRRVVERGEDASEPLKELFQTEKALNQRFQRLSDRVTVANGRLLYDGDPVDSSVEKQVFRFLDEGVPLDKWVGLVRFVESVMLNPSENSRQQLYAWVGNHDITINDDGAIIAYKGVQKGENGTYLSLNRGTAWVNDEEKNGQIPQAVGDVVTMPRSKVADDPHAACSVGLHVGTHRYASTYGNSLLRVLVEARDVVSVPHDAKGEKIRVHRYLILEENVEPLSTAYYSTASYRPAQDEDDGYEDEWEDEDDDWYDEDDESGYDPDYDETPDQSGAIGHYPRHSATVTTASSWDTRQNYTRQQRGPDGKFIRQ